MIEYSSQATDMSDSPPITAPKGGSSSAQQAAERAILNLFNTPNGLPDGLGPSTCNCQYVPPTATGRCTVDYFVCFTFLDTASLLAQTPTYRVWAYTTFNGQNYSSVFCCDPDPTQAVVAAFGSLNDVVEQHSGEGCLPVEFDSLPVGNYYEGTILSVHCPMLPHGKAGKKVVLALEEGTLSVRNYYPDQPGYVTVYSYYYYYGYVLSLWDSGLLTLSPGGQNSFPIQYLAGCNNLAPCIPPFRIVLGNDNSFAIWNKDGQAVWEAPIELKPCAEDLNSTVVEVKQKTIF